MLTAKEIISINDKLEDTINIESIHNNIKELYPYYRDIFGCEPMLMVTDVFNACQYGLIVSSDRFEDAAREYAEKEYDDITDDIDIDMEIEVILFNSIMLKELIK